jgi:hypothetical protein
LSKKFGEWYQKTNKKKEDTNKLTTLAFKMIPILHNTLLATPKIKFFLRLLPIFGAHQPTHQLQFLWSQTQILLWENLSFWGGSQTQILLQGLLPILGTHWGLLGFRGPKSNVTLGAFFLLGSLPSSFYSGDFAHFAGPLGPFGVKGLKMDYGAKIFLLLRNWVFCAHIF